MRSTVSRRWGFKGKPLTVFVQQGFKNFYVYSAVSVINGKSFDYIMPGVDTACMNSYLEAFSKDLGKTKVLLYMDQAGWHKSKDLKRHKNIEIRYLPAYSPELNPVERLWKHLKNETVHNMLFKSLVELEKSVINEFIKMTNRDFLDLCRCNYLYLFI